MDVFGSTFESQRKRNIFNLKSDLQKTNNELLELKQTVNKHEIVEEKTCNDLTEIQKVVEENNKKTREDISQMTDRIIGIEFSLRVVENSYTDVKQLADDIKELKTLIAGLKSA